MSDQQDPATAERELERLMTAFFRAVSFEPGETPAYGSIGALFIEAGLLVRGGPTQEVWSVRGFTESREAALRAGRQERFLETERSAATQVFGNVAQRFSAYAKSGVLDGAPFEARGMISTQFIRTPDGWRISAMAWDDERPTQGVNL